MKISADFTAAQLSDHSNSYFQNTQTNQSPPCTAADAYPEVPEKDDPIKNAVYKNGDKLPFGYDFVVFLSGDGHQNKVVGQFNPENPAEFHVKDPHSGAHIATLKKTTLAESRIINGREEFFSGKPVWMLAPYTGLRGGAALSTPEDIDSYMSNDDEIQSMMLSPREKCFDCAQRVEKMLNYQNIPHFTRAMYIWFNKNDTVPKTHYVVVACPDEGVKIAIDPTGGQFDNVFPSTEYLNTWASEFRSGFNNNAIIKYKDFANARTSTTEVNSFFHGNADAFVGNVLR